jgi:putative membrane protein
MEAQQNSGVDRRNQLAADRTVFAAERTYAAWVRTGLAALAGGVGAEALLENAMPQWSIRLVATILILFSVFSFGAAVWRHVHPGPPPPKTDAPQIAPVLLVIATGFLILVALSALIGIWLGG